MRLTLNFYLQKNIGCINSLNTATIKSSSFSYWKNFLNSIKQILIVIVFKLPGRSSFITSSNLISFMKIVWKIDSSVAIIMEIFLFKDFPAIILECFLTNFKMTNHQLGTLQDDWPHF